MKPPTNAFREALRATTSGACTVLLSTGLSCVFAVAIESSAHRLQYKFFPHWYDGKVKYALGLPHLQYQTLDSETIQAAAVTDNPAKSVVATTTTSTTNTTNTITSTSDAASHNLWESVDFQTPLHLLQNEGDEMDNFSTTDIQNDIPIWKKQELMLDSDSSTQSKFQSYSDKIQEKVQLISPERVSKILLTTAMTG
jgi:hypothetical protein